MRVDLKMWGGVGGGSGGLVHSKVILVPQKCLTKLPTQKWLPVKLPAEGETKILENTSELPSFL